MVTIFRATAVRVHCRYVCLHVTTDAGTTLDLSAIALINHPLQMQFVADVMVDFVIYLFFCGYFTQYSIFTNRKSHGRHTRRIACSAVYLQQHIGRAIALQACLSDRRMWFELL